MNDLNLMGPASAQTTRLDTEAHLRRAVLPFRLLEELGIPSGYERSFKVSHGQLLANRYMLGVNLDRLSLKQLLNLCHALEMPPNLLTEMRAALEGANTVLFGFEEGINQHRYKIYLEYWDSLAARLRRHPRDRSAALLHLGFKWDPDHPKRQGVARYICYPMISNEDIDKRLIAVYENAAASPSAVASLAILHQTVAPLPDRSLIYLEACESGSPRRSFDINLYRSGFDWRAVMPALDTLFQAYAINTVLAGKMASLVASKPIGHISGGVDRHGRDFFCGYFEAK